MKSIKKSHPWKWKVEWWLGERGLQLGFNGDTLLVWGDENVLETDGGEGCTTAGVYLMSLTCTLKNG